MSGNGNGRQTRSNNGGASADTGEPLSNGTGRDPHTGFFLPGNKCGKGGNPHAEKVTRLRAAIYEATNDEDVRDIWKKLLALAKGGNLTAAKEVLDRLLGKSKETVEVTGGLGEAIGSIREGFATLMQNPELAKAIERGAIN